MPTRLVKRGRPEPGKAATDPLDRLRENAPRRVPLPVSMAEAMSAVMAERRKLNRSKRTRVARAFYIALEELGLKAPQGTEVYAVKDGTVRIGTTSPAVAHQLGVVYRAELLKGMQRLLEGKDTLLRLAVKPKA